MITKIGLVAGDIWDYLESHDKKVKLSQLVEDLKQDKTVILMSLGWLAREGHIVLEGDKDSYFVILNSN